MLAPNDLDWMMTLLLGVRLIEVLDQVVEQRDALGAKSFEQVLVCVTPRKARHFGRSMVRKLHQQRERRRLIRNQQLIHVRDIEAQQHLLIIV